MRHPVVAAAMLLIFIAACEKTSPPDPCADVPAYAVSFAADEAGSDVLNVETEEVILNSFVRFEATAPTEGYFNTFTWTIGKNPEPQEGKLITVGFGEKRYSAGDVIDIKVTATSPDHSCFPGRTNAVSFTRKFRIKDLKNANIIGRYKGIFGNDATKRDTQVVEIRYIEPIPGESLLRYVVMFNVQKGCNMTITNPNNSMWYLISRQSTAGNNYLTFEAEDVFFNGCMGPSAVAQLSSTNRDSIQIDYEYSASIQQVFPKLKDRFRGKRL